MRAKLTWNKRERKAAGPNIAEGQGESVEDEDEQMAGVRFDRAVFGFDGVDSWMVGIDGIWNARRRMSGICERERKPVVLEF